MNKKLLVISCTLLFLLASVTVQVMAAPVRSNKWAVVVGVGRIFGDSLGATNDAKLMSQILKSDGFTNIRLLLDDSATRANIINAVNWMVANEDAGSTVVFFFSGHSSTYGMSLIDSTLSYSGLASMLSGLESTKVFLCIAGCYSGAAIPYLSGSGRIVRSSATATNPAVDSGHYSLFGSWFLGAAIKKGLADYNGDGQVSIEEASRYCTIGLMNDQYPGDMFL